MQINTFAWMFAVCRSNQIIQSTIINGKGKFKRGSLENLFKLKKENVDNTEKVRKHYAHVSAWIYIFSKYLRHYAKFAFDLLQAYIVNPT